MHNRAAEKTNVINHKVKMTKKKEKTKKQNNKKVTVEMTVCQTSPI